MKVTSVWVDFVFRDEIRIEFRHKERKRQCVIPVLEGIIKVGSLARALRKREGLFRATGTGWYWVRGGN